MNGVLISIIGLVFLSIITDILLPSGNMNRFVKSIFGVVMLLIIVNPIVDIFKSVSSNSDVVIDKGVVYSLNKLKSDNIQKNIINTLNINGISGVSVEIESNLYDYEYIIDNIYVYLDKLVLSENVVNINISDEILKLIQSVIDIENHKVVFYG